VRLTSKAVKLIEGKNFAHIATLMPDGSPQVSPVWIDHEDNRILVNTAEGRVKQKNLTRDPRVAISIADQSNPYDKVLIRGRVLSQTLQGADAHIDKLAKKYIGKDRYPWRAPGEKRIIIRIEPNRISD
jgi:PPOX class probable F420-dependent enzyme